MWPSRLPPVTRGMGYWPMSLVEEKKHGRAARGTVGFFAGCIGSVLYDEVNRKAVELLAAAGVDVIAPRAQGLLRGDPSSQRRAPAAKELARRNIDVFLPNDGPDVDRIVTNIAGCGAMLREYDRLLRDDPDYAARARSSSSGFEISARCWRNWLPRRLISIGSTRP